MISGLSLDHGSLRGGGGGVGGPWIRSFGLILVCPLVLDLEITLYSIMNQLNRSHDYFVLVSP